jgi:hypothetical protein
MAEPDFSGPVRWRKDATGETARLAAIAKAITAPKQRERVYGVLAAVHPEAMTPEQITRALHDAGGRDLLMSIRPRCSELARMGLIRDSGLRGMGEGGCKAIKWVATTGDTKGGEHV